MGNCNRYYFGPYIKVYPSKKTYTKNIRTCTKTTCLRHGGLSSASFCSTCGSLIEDCPVIQERHESLEEILLDEFNDCDLFSTVCIDDEDYQFFVSNSYEQGGVYIDEHGEYSVQENPDYFNQKDWVRLVDKLTERGYKFEKGIGVIAYYN